MIKSPAPWPKIVSLLNRALLLTEDEEAAVKLRDMLKQARAEAMDQCVESHRERVIH